MASFSQALSNAVGNAVCNALRVNPFRGTPTVPGALFEHWYRNNCNREPDPPPQPPFSGGQCEGVQYRIFARVLERRNDGADRIATAEQIVLGPIQDIRLNDACATPPNSLVSVSSNGALGTVTNTNTIAIYACNDGSVAFYQTGFTILNLDVTRVDGLPDECDPPPPPPPPPFQPIQIGPFNITYNNNEGDDIDININNLVLGFPVIINGNLNIPISLSYNNPEFNSPVDLDFNFNFEIDGEGNPRPNLEPDDRSTRGNPGRDGKDGDKYPDDYKSDDYDDEPPDDVPDEDEEPEPEECPTVERPRPNQPLVIRAVVVNVSEPGNRTSLIFDPESEAPAIYAPAAGWIHFKIPFNNFQYAWLSDIPVKNGRNFIPVPWEGGAIDWRFTPNGTGVSANVTPVFGARELQATRPDVPPACN